MTSATAVADAARTMPGLDFLRALRDGEVPAAPIQGLLGFDLVEVDPGRVVFSCVPAEHHYNPIGVVHGGLAGILLDSAMGASVHSMLPLGRAYTTQQTSFHLVRPITLATAELRCAGSVVHLGGRQATAEGRLVRAGDGKLLAHGTSTCLVLDVG